jgi:hypothetical protein
MVVIAGESNSTDMQDLWVLDIDGGRWYLLNITNQESFKAKRFLTACSVTNNRLITFGGCHSEYEHLADLDMFDLTDFIESRHANRAIACQKLNSKSQGPSSRWGHSAAVYKDKIYIIGGRNASDVSDIHCLDVDSLTWTRLQLSEP